MCGGRGENKQIWTFKNIPKLIELHWAPGLNNELLMVLAQELIVLLGWWCLPPCTVGCWVRLVKLDATACYNYLAYTIIYIYLNTYTHVIVCSCNKCKLFFIAHIKMLYAAAPLIAKHFVGCIQNRGIIEKDIFDNFLKTLEWHKMLQYIHYFIHMHMTLASNAFTTSTTTIMFAFDYTQTHTDTYLNTRTLIHPIQDTWHKVN